MLLCLTFPKQEEHFLLFVDVPKKSYERNDVLSFSRTRIYFILATSVNKIPDPKYNSGESRMSLLRWYWIVTTTKCYPSIHRDFLFHETTSHDPDKFTRREQKPRPVCQVSSKLQFSIESENLMKSWNEDQFHNILQRNLLLTLMI